MHNFVKLLKAVGYSNQRISVEEVSLDDFITTDNMLPNKAGIIKAMNLPPQGGTMPAYKRNNILVANIRPYLKKIWFADRDGGSSADVLIFNVRKGYYPKFIYYALFRDDFFNHMMRGKKGTKMPRGDKNHILEYLIPDYDFSIQQNIAEVLSSIDSKIEINNRIKSDLEEISKTLYGYWFVQFEFPNTNGQPYKSSGKKMVWNQELMREIPEGWQVKQLGKVLKTNLGGTPPTKNKEYWENASIPWISSGETANFPIISSNEFITQKGVDNSATTILPIGSVLISIVRYIRPSILAIDACTNQSVVGILESEELKNPYIYPYIANEIPRLMKTRTGAQQPHINKESIDGTLLYIPPIDLLNKYYQISKPIYIKIINIAIENKQLTDLRDWLLPLMMNGQVVVKDRKTVSKSNLLQPLGGLGLDLPDSIMER